MKRLNLAIYIIFIIILAGGFDVYADNKGRRPVLTVEDSIERARSNYPLSKNKEIINDLYKLNITKTNMAFIPNIKISGRVSYQSDVVAMPIDLPIFDFKLNKDQYQFVGEISQPIFDAGGLWANKNYLSARSEADQAMLEVQLYNIQQNVIAIYFNILLIDEQLTQNDMLIEQLVRNLKTVSSYVENGVGQLSDTDKINVEIISAGQKRDSLNTSKKAQLIALSQFIGSDVGDYTLTLPDNNRKFYESKAASLLNYKSSNMDNLAEMVKARPELNYYNAKENEIDNLKKTNLIKGLPVIDAFFQGGYSNPGLNILKNGFSPYYVVGLRLNWNLTGLYTKDKEDQIVMKQKQQTVVQKNEFLFNAKISIEQNINEIENLSKQLESDDEIIEFRTRIVESSETKMKNGVLSVTDLLNEIDKLDLARQNKSYHKIQQLMKIYELKQMLNIWD